jgi:chromosome segregation ATPase
MVTQKVQDALKKFQDTKNNMQRHRNPGIKSPSSQTKNTVEGHSSRLEQVEDGISELEDEIEIKEKTEELLVKQLKSYERNMQELSDSIKTPNLRLMRIEEGE